MITATQTPYRLPTMERHAPARPADQTPLATFESAVGYKLVPNPETGDYEQHPLTLADMLYPLEGEEIVMSESLNHDLWCTWLKVMVQNYLQDRGWLVISNVEIHWARPNVPPRAPDIAAIPETPFPADKGVYRVAADGPLPAFVMELTSKSTRWVDLADKPLLYAAMGIQEFLIVDLWPGKGRDWQLRGYRLSSSSPLYEELTPAEDGSLSFETVGLRFVPRGRDIAVYELVSGERLLRPDEERQARAEAVAKAIQEQQARTEAEAKAIQEQQARTEAEARADTLEAELKRLQAELARLRDTE